MRPPSKASTPPFAPWGCGQKRHVVENRFVLRVHLHQSAEGCPIDLQQWVHGLGRVEPLDRALGARCARCGCWSLEARAFTILEPLKVLLAQINVGEFADMAHVVLSMILDTPVPFVAIKGTYIAKVVEVGPNSPCLGWRPSDGSKFVSPEHLPVNQLFLGRRLAEWWDRQPDVGPKISSTEWQQSGRGDP